MITIESAANQRRFAEFTVKLERREIIHRTRPIPCIFTSI